MFKDDINYIEEKTEIISEYKLVSLSYREREILMDLSYGLSSNEVAANQNLSINTVRMVINTIYDKLCANNLAEAIQVATERKII